ncbi:DNA cytosine methyltransferase [Stenotrophomonas sp. ESTM1D_MKCIP4_1]|uniref:DNA cytosine methyltransferase n=1 Tax=Stenotrophomonas sp. ESTM1D_MKCIP4_1 TaxID=2072414 RepID=UPI0020B16DEA|nr:DNA cytosine methyltransferase [Stenotrophomonas sp. ESTM1D_MKCIP4_1]
MRPLTSLMISAGGFFQYVVEWRKLVASDYGAGTSRERLFLLARRDGEAIVWPEASHGPAPDQTPRVTAADCLDFSIPCPSIFTRGKALADATMRRVAKGVMRHVINSADPFIVPVTHQGGDRVHDVRDPMRTITAANRGELMLAAPELAPFIAEHANSSHALGSMRADEPLRTVCAGVKGGHFSVVAPTLVQTGYGEREGQAPRALDLLQPLGTVVAGGVKHAVAAAHLVKFRGDSSGAAATEPVPTITSGAGAARPAGAAHALGLAAASLVTLRRNMVGADARTPLTTVAAQAEHHAVSSAFMVQAAHGEGKPGGVQRWGNGSKDARAPVGTVTASGNGGHAMVQAELAQLTPDQEAGALRVAAFLVKYYGSGIAVDLHDPVDTITTKDRHALVTVQIQGVPHVIVDIGLRMLKPHELYRAQGFPVGYIIDRTANGTPLSTSAAVRMVGNSVSPPPLRALAEANLDRMAADTLVAKRKATGGIHGSR